MRESHQGASTATIFLKTSNPLSWINKRNKMRTYQAISNKETRTFQSETLTDARHWVINHLDVSNEWTVKEIEPVKKGDNITIIGRRWFDRINGNTYFSAVGLVNGKQAVSIYFEYGYGNHYEDRIFQELEKAGYCPDVLHYSNGGSERLWNYCSRKEITKYVTHSDVNRKKDL